MAWVITGTVTKTAVETEPVGVTDYLNAPTGYHIPEGRIQVLEGLQDRDVVHSDTEGTGLVDVWNRYPDVSVGAATASGSLTLTGSGTAVNNDLPTTISATVLPEYRAVRITVDGLGGETATIYRESPYVAGMQAVRLATVIDTAESFSGVDYEAPMDVPLTYTAEVDGSLYIAFTVTIDSEGRDWYTALGSPSMSRVVLVESFPAWTRPLARSQVRPLHSQNPLVILHARQGIAGTLSLLTLTHSEAEAMRYMLEVSPLFQFKTPIDRGLPDGSLYLLAGDYVEERVVVNANEPTRRWVIEVVEVDRPPLVVPPPTENTWQDWDDETLSNSTWEAWKSKSWLDILVEDLSLTP